MFPFNYIICSNELGNGRISKVYKIQEVEPPHTVLIAKIYDISKRNEYEKEKNILMKLSEQNDNNEIRNDYIIKLKNIDVILEHSNLVNNDSKYLIFDYLIHGNLSEYLYIIPIINQFKEDHIKLLCYKLLQSLKKCFEQKISHNKLDINNIMLDNEFNPILIHFSEATINELNNNFNKDLYDLGIIS